MSSFYLHLLCFELCHGVIIDHVLKLSSQYLKMKLQFFVRNVIFDREEQKLDIIEDNIEESILRRPMQYDLIDR